MDAAFSKEGAGVGLVVRNSEGEIEAVMAENIVQGLDAQYAETVAFLKAMYFARDFGISQFVLEGDALNAVQRLNSQQHDLSTNGHLIEGMRRMVKEFHSVKFQYINRDCNRAAHEAAKLTTRSKGCNVWFVNFPKTVLYAAKNDSS